MDLEAITVAFVLGVGTLQKFMDFLRFSNESALCKMIMALPFDEVVGLRLSDSTIFF